MKVIISKFVVPKGYMGISLYPFVFLRYGHLKADKVFLNHERIHLRQQLELLILPFFIIYSAEFVIRYIRLRNWNAAYRAISFEKEAYDNDKDLDYLKSRRFWRFVKYL